MDARTSDQSAPVGQPSYGISITHGPDTTGKWWMMITVQSAVMSFTYGVPVDGALDFIRDFAQNFRDVHADAKRKASGIVMPNGTKLVIPRQ